MAVFWFWALQALLTSPCWYKQPSGWYKNTDKEVLSEKWLSNYFLIWMGFYEGAFHELLPAGQQASITLRPGAEKWVASTLLQAATEAAWKVIILNETFCCGSIHHTLWILDSTSESSNLTWPQTSLLCLTYFDSSSSSCKCSLKDWHQSLF